MAARPCGDRCRARAQRAKSAKSSYPTGCRAKNGSAASSSPWVRGPEIRQARRVVPVATSQRRRSRPRKAAMRAKSHPERRGRAARAQSVLARPYRRARTIRARGGVQKIAKSEGDSWRRIGCRHRKRFVVVACDHAHELGRSDDQLEHRPDSRRIPRRRRSPPEK